MHFSATQKLIYIEKLREENSSKKDTDMSTKKFCKFGWVCRIVEGIKGGEGGEGVGVVFALPY